MRKITELKELHSRGYRQRRFFLRENNAVFAPTSPTVTSRPYHTAPAEAGREGVNLKAGPQAREIAEPQPPARADSPGTTTAEEGKRSAVSAEEEAAAGDTPERGGWTEDWSVSKARACSLISFRERKSQFRGGEEAETGDQAYLHCFAIKLQT